MKKLFYSSLLLLLVIVTFSCKKNTDDNKPDPDPVPEKKCYVNKISQTPRDYTAIVYNAAMQAERMNFFADSTEEISYRFTRDKTGRITVMDLYDESEKVIYVTFEYKTDNTLNKALVYAFDNGVPMEVNRLEFEYNSLKQISRMNQIDPKTGKLQGYDILTFDAKGNAIKSESHYINESGDDEIMAINEYEYDDKKNPKLAIGFPLYLDYVYDISQNNVTKEIEKDAQGRINRTVTHTYEYTAEGYPKSSTYTTSGSNVKSTYDYTCK